MRVYILAIPAVLLFGLAIMVHGWKRTIVLFLSSVVALSIPDASIVWVLVGALAITWVLWILYFLINISKFSPRNEDVAF